MEAIERTALSTDWITVLLLAAFLILVIAKTAHLHKFSDFSNLFITDKYLLLHGREPKILHAFNILMFVVNVISVSLFIYILYRVMHPSEISRPIILFIRIATAYAAFVLLKFAVEKIVANILSLDKKMDFYLFYKLSYRNFLAMLILPANIIFIYLWWPNILGLFIFLGFILLMNFIIVADIFKKNRQYIFNHFFYFILYLCALEMGPYFILYKAITA